MKVKYVFLFLCLSVGSLTVKLLAGPGKVNNYFWGGYPVPPPYQEKLSLEKNTTL